MDKGVIILDLRKKYLDDYTDLIFSKYFYKLVLERKYIENFGEIELSKKKKIYDTMIINKKLEQAFYTKNPSSVPLANLMDYSARKEYIDLERQIYELEENIAMNEAALKELKYFQSKDIFKKISTLVARTSPLMNRNKKAEDIWKKFAEALKDNNWKRIVHLSAKAEEIRLLKIKDVDDQLEEAIQDIADQRKAMEKRYPFNQLEILEDEITLENKKTAEKKDLKTMEESYEKMADIYLSTSDAPRWYS